MGMLENDLDEIARAERTRAMMEAPKPVQGFDMKAEGYESLARILHMAYSQSAFGKGKERHANARPFDAQPISTIPELLGPVGVGGTAYQVIKKTQEAVGMHQRGDRAAAIAELLGAIVYAAATIRTIEKDMAE